MRLLSVDEWRLEDFDDVDTQPRYAILSHRWEGDELRYSEIGTVHREFETGRADLTTRKNKSITKIDNARAEAKSRGLDWLWCDTCCIDPSSSAELSESINSMYAWYAKATVCLAYIHDQSAEAFLAGREVVSSIKTVAKGVLTATETKLPKPDWFTRGWTLQELIAPKHLMFFDKDWMPVGQKTDSKVLTLVAKHTRIDTAILTGERSIRSVSIARRMSWAADRRVTKKEDIAYSLLGLFGINMPLLYGEGAVRAFRRLQQQIILDSTDHSIFAWSTPSLRHEPHTWLTSSPTQTSIIKGAKPVLVSRKSVSFDLSPDRRSPYHGLLADSPVAFSGCGDAYGDSQWLDAEAYQESNRGLGVRFDLQSVPEEENLFKAKLNCKSRSSGLFLGIYLKRLGYETQQYARVRHDEILDLDKEPPSGQAMVYVRQAVSEFDPKAVEMHFLVPRNLNADGYKLLRQSSRPLSESARLKKPRPQAKNREWLHDLDDNGYLLARHANKVSAILVFGRENHEQEQVSILFATTEDLQVGYHVVKDELPGLDKVERQLAKRERQLHTSGQKACIGAHVVKVDIALVIDFPRCLYVADIRINHAEPKKR